MTFCFRALFLVLVTILFNSITCVGGNTGIVNFVALPAESPAMTFPTWFVSFCLLWPHPQSKCFFPFPSPLKDGNDTFQRREKAEFRACSRCGWSDGRSGRMGITWPGRMEFIQQVHIAGILASSCECVGLVFLFILWGKIIGKAQWINHFSSIPVIYTWKFMILCRWRLNNGTINHFTQHATSTLMYTLSVRAFLHLPRLVRIWRGFVVNPFPSLWSWSPYSSGFFLNLCSRLFLWCLGPLEWHLRYCPMFYAIMILFLSTSGESSTPSKNDGWPVTLEQLVYHPSYDWILFTAKSSLLGQGPSVRGCCYSPLLRTSFCPYLEASLLIWQLKLYIFQFIHTYTTLIISLTESLITTFIGSMYKNLHASALRLLRWHSSIPSGDWYLSRYQI